MAEEITGYREYVGKDYAVAMYSVILPYGRSKGDVNGDGVIDSTDADLIHDYFMGNVDTVGDEVAEWCADVYEDDEIDDLDSAYLYAMINNNISYIGSDYYNNWTFETDSFYYDVKINGMTSQHSCFVVSNCNGKDTFMSAECMDGFVRVYVKCCPIVEVPCSIFYTLPSDNVYKEYASKYFAMTMAVATLPYGRSKGDVNGDGVIDDTDANIIINHSSKTELIEDEIALWCADVNGNGKIQSGDGAIILQYVNQTYQPTLSDYYNNWTFETDSFYYDVPVNGMTTQHSCVVIPKSDNKKSFDHAKCMDGFVRIYAKCCPVVDTDCCIFYTLGDASDLGIGAGMLV